MRGCFSCKSPPFAKASSYTTLGRLVSSGYRKQLAGRCHPRLTNYKAEWLNRTVGPPAKLCSLVKSRRRFVKLRGVLNSSPQYRLGGINRAAYIAQAVTTIVSKKQWPVQVDDASLLRHEHRWRNGQ